MDRQPERVRSEAPAGAPLPFLRLEAPPRRRATSTATRRKAIFKLSAGVGAVGLATCAVAVALLTLPRPTARSGGDGVAVDVDVPALPAGTPDRDVLRHARRAALLAAAAQAGGARGLALLRVAPDVVDEALAGDLTLKDERFADDAAASAGRPRRFHAVVDPAVTGAVICDRFNADRGEPTVALVLADRRGARVFDDEEGEEGRARAVVERLARALDNVCVRTDVIGPHETLPGADRFLARSRRRGDAWLLDGVIGEAVRLRAVAPVRVAWTSRGGEVDVDAWRDAVVKRIDASGGVRRTVTLALRDANADDATDVVAALRRAPPVYEAARTASGEIRITTFTGVVGVADAVDQLVVDDDGRRLELTELAIAGSLVGRLAQPENEQQRR